MERTCSSCGRDPGDGASCRHCGATVYRYAVSSEEWEEAAGPDGMLGTDDALDIDDEIVVPDAVIPPPDPADLGFDPLPPTFTPPPTRPPPPPTRPAEAVGPTRQPSGAARGCGCGVAILVLIALIGAGVAFFFVSSSGLELSSGGIEVTATPGQCVDLVGDDGVVLGTSTVPCSEPHDAEAFHRAQFADGPFPGDAVVADQADATCLAEFEDYVGIGYYDSEYWIDWLVPSADGWATGDREVVCLLVSGDGSPLTGSAHGSGR